MKRYFILSLGALILLLPVASTFLYAAFEYKWWYPMGEHNNGREFILYMFHWGMMAIGLGIILLNIDK
jgi:hypothetical protein